MLPTAALAQQPPHTLTIKVVKAKTNQPITDERLNVALRLEQIGSVAMPTDKTGIILVDYGKATIIRILGNMYGDCRPRAELYTNYSIDTTLLHRHHHRANWHAAAPDQPPSPYVLTLYEIPKTYVPNFPNPPATTLPHSDENPHAPN